MNNEEGYNIGLIATPIASYLSIPVIVTDEIDHEVRTVLSELNVKKTIICGENLEGYGEFLKFDTVEEIVDNTTMLLRDKFGGFEDIIHSGITPDKNYEIMVHATLNSNKDEILDANKYILEQKLKELFKGERWTLNNYNDFRKVY